MLREITEKDIPYIVEWEMKFFNSSLGKEMLKKQIDNQQSGFYMIIEENVPVGYLSSYQVIDECELLNFFVESKYQNKGYGQKALWDLEVSLREKGFKKIVLDVNEDNIGAIHVYKKAGFAEVGRRKKYYQDGKSAIIMQKDVLR